jgi:hypothetical protein
MKASGRLFTSLCRISLAAALAFGLGAGAFSPARAHAETRSGHQFTYYNNAQHQTVVGVWVWCNDGQNYHWGSVTPYDTITASGC